MIKWNRLDEGLPTVGYYYLVTVEHEDISMTLCLKYENIPRFNEKRWRWDGKLVPIKDEKYMIAWAEMPEPYCAFNYC